MIEGLVVGGLVLFALWLSRRELLPAPVRLTRTAAQGPVAKRCSGCPGCSAHQASQCGEPR